MDWDDKHQLHCEYKVRETILTKYSRDTYESIDWGTWALDLIVDLTLSRQLWAICGMLKIETNVRVILLVLHNLLLRGLLKSLFYSIGCSAYLVNNIKGCNLQLVLASGLLLYGCLPRLGARPSLGRNRLIFLITGDYLRTAVHEINSNVATNKWLTSWLLWSWEDDHAHA